MKYAKKWKVVPFTENTKIKPNDDDKIIEYNQQTIKNTLKPRNISENILNTESVNTLLNEQKTLNETIKKLDEPSNFNRFEEISIKLQLNFEKQLEEFEKRLLESIKNYLDVNESKLIKRKSQPNVLTPNLFSSEMINNFAKDSPIIKRLRSNRNKELLGTLSQEKNKQKWSNYDQQRNINSNDISMSDQ